MPGPQERHDKKLNGFYRAKFWQGAHYEARFTAIV